MRVLLVLWLALVTGLSHAQTTLLMPTGGASNIYAPYGMTMADGAAYDRFLGRNFGAGGGSSLSVVERYALPIGGNTIEVAAARTLAWGAIAEAAIAVGGAAYVGAQLGAPIALAFGWGQYDIGDTRCTATLTGWQCDAGQEPGLDNGVVFCFNSCPADGSGGYQSAVEAFNAVSLAARCDRIGLPSSCGANGHDVVAVSLVPQSFPENVTSGSAQVLTNHTYPGGGNQPVAGVFWQRVVIKTCPPVVDALNPAYSSSNPPPDKDGKCPTGRYSSATNAQVKDRLTTYGAPAYSRQLAEDVLAKGQPITAEGPRTLSGPASVTGQPKTSTETKADGSTVTKTTTPTTNYTYGGSSVTYNTTNNTTTETCTGGSCNTTTEGTDTTPEQSDQCKTNPNSAGCAELGDPPDESPQWQSRQVDFTVDDLGLPSGCPSPHSWSFRGWSIVLNYQPACDVAPTVRLALVALSALGAALYIVATVTKG